MTDLFNEPDHATPLTEEEKAALIPADVTFRRDLNQAEHSNIERGQDWAFRVRRRELLSEEFIVGLHARLFGDVWRGCITGSCWSTHSSTAMAATPA